MHDESLTRIVTERFAAAIAAVAGADVDASSAAVRATNDPKFGDYQCNAAMALAKSLKSKPRDIAQKIVDAVDLAGIADPLEIAGPGFINVRLSDSFLASFLGEVPAPPTEDAADRVGIPQAAAPDTVVIDYSSPNIAKQMHVGHLRSTVIGDVFARTLDFLGHKVVRQNHVGDWGTAMGMVILGLWYTKARQNRGETSDVIRARLKELLAAKGQPPEARRKLVEPIGEQWTEDLRTDILPSKDMPIEDLELGYQFVQALSAAAVGLGCTVSQPNGEQDDIADIPRKVTAHLQEGAPRGAHERAEWTEARAISLRYCQGLYDRLGVLLIEKDVCGESFYDKRLAPIIGELETKFADGKVATTACVKGAADVAARVEFRMDKGARCLFFYDETNEPLFKNADGDELPMLVQKSDGAFLYATTDLAAIRYRIEDLHGTRLIYVTDARQKLHFRMLFSAARAIGWAGENVSLEHVTFGSILGGDRKPLKTREGDNVKLGDLLDEAEARARKLIDERGQAASDAADADDAEPVSDAEKERIAQRVGIAAVKYADLSRDRVGDYVFDWDTMLAMQGNTAPYMMYAYARIRSIYRKAAERFGSPDVYAADVKLDLNEPAERALALRIARLPDAIETLANDLAPHTLCAYLYDVAADFMRFYEACPVLRAEHEPTRLSRMRLCDLTARTLKLGLSLLGIEVIERM